MDGQRAWCDNCRAMSIVSMRHDVGADEKKSPYTDLRCDECHWIIATLEGWCEIKEHEQQVA